MAVFERCCCCSLRTGCLVFGTLGLVMALVNIGLEILEFVSYGLATEEELQFMEELTKVFLATSILSLLQSVVSITTCSLLIYGIHQAKYKLILPTLVWNPINVCIDIITIIFYSVLFDIDLHDLFLHIVLITTAVYALVSLLCWLYVFSHWRMVKVQVGAPERMEM
eukprot:GFUD01029824.1.p1 GENE.GFUD01029824.1~~GFUD01029824.1.p1  ORF type:complete len:189 (-),score=30.06 GFUD01029824.1:296-796(-)